MVGLAYGGVVTCLLIATVIGAHTHSVLWGSVTLLALGAAIFLGGVVTVILSGQLSSVRSDLERLRARRAAGYGVRAKGSRRSGRASPMDNVLNAGWPPRRSTPFPSTWSCC